MNDRTTALADPLTDDTLTQPFTGPSPYDNYVHASALNSMQQPLTEAPDEMGFLVTTQVMELWFTLIVHEWPSAPCILWSPASSRKTGSKACGSTT